MLLFCVRDTTDLADRAEAFEQAITMDGSVPTYDSKPVYCEAVYNTHWVFNVGCVARYHQHTHERLHFIFLLKNAAMGATARMCLGDCG